MSRSLRTMVAAIALSLSGCASKPPPVPSSQPKLPPPPAGIMKPTEANFLCRIESFLSGKPIEQIEQSGNCKRASDTSQR